MGIRSLTILKDEAGKDVCVMYRQFDGYPSGYGQALAVFLSEIQMVNGVSDRGTKIANGIGCLAAQVVAHFKREPGGIYLHAAGTRDIGEDYIYYVTGKEGYEPVIEVIDYSGQILYHGPASSYDSTD